VREFGVLRRSFIIAEIFRLAESFPAALEAIRERRDRAVQALRSDSCRVEDALDAIDLNRRLGVPERNVVLLEAYASHNSPDPTTLRAILSGVLEDICSQRRYDLVGRWPDDIVTAVKSRVTSHEKGEALVRSTRWGTATQSSANAEVRDRVRASVINLVSSSYEALIGNGHLNHARSVIAAAYDSLGPHADVITAICEAAIRVGRSDVASDVLLGGLQISPDKDSPELRALRKRLGLTEA
jgi:hypothetical protein